MSKASAMSSRLFSSSSLFITFSSAVKHHGSNQFTSKLNLLNIKHCEQWSHMLRRSACVVLWKNKMQSCCPHAILQIVLVCSGCMRPTISPTTADRRVMVRGAPPRAQGEGLVRPASL